MATFEEAVRAVKCGKKAFRASSVKDITYHMTPEKKEFSREELYVFEDGNYRLSSTDPYSSFGVYKLMQDDFEADDWVIE